MGQLHGRKNPWIKEYTLRKEGTRSHSGLIEKLPFGNRHGIISYLELASTVKCGMIAPCIAIYQHHG